METMTMQELKEREFCLEVVMAVLVQGRRDSGDSTKLLRNMALTGLRLKIVRDQIKERQNQ